MHGHTIMYVKKIVMVAVLRISMNCIVSVVEDITNIHEVGEIPAYHTSNTFYKFCGANFQYSS